MRRLTITKRQRRAFFWSFGAFMLLGGAMAAAADSTGPTTPTGFGNLFPIPDFTNGGPKTLFENYGQSVWFLDTELDFKDVLQNAGNGLANLLFYILTSVVYAAISLIYWLTSLTKIDTIGDAMAGLVGASAGGLMTWLFPSALAFGAVVAYTQRARDGRGAGIGQVAWLIASGVLGVSLAVSPQTWTGGVDMFRQLGSTSITSATADAVTVKADYPLPWPEVTYTQDARQTSMRKTSDAVWRSLVVTPWCLANYGSIEACQRYGISMLNIGADVEKRKDYIKNTVYRQEASPGQGGKESPTGQWTKGERWPERLGIVGLSAILGIVFSILLIVLGFAAMASLILSMLLLAIGAFFAMLWVIPGRPRQWGINWFEMLIGAVLASLVNLLLLQAVITMLTAVLGNVTLLGWGQTLALALTATLVAFGMRRQIEGALQTQGGGGSLAGASLMGYMALRGAGRVARGISGVGRGLGRAGRHYGGALRGGGFDEGVRPGRRRPRAGGLQDLGERTPPPAPGSGRPSFRQLGAPHAGSSAASPAAISGGPATGPSGQGSGGPRALPAGAAGTRQPGTTVRGPNIRGAAFPMPKGSAGAYPVPHNDPGRRTERLRPPEQQNGPTRRASSSPGVAVSRPPARGTASRPARVDLPEAPRMVRRNAFPTTSKTSTTSTRRAPVKTHQFRPAQPAPVIQGEVIASEPAAPRRPRRARR